MNEAIETPQIARVLAKLSVFLRERGGDYGLSALGCFGSVARKDATPESDVDVVYKAAPAARMTLFDLAMLRDELTELLERPVDLIEFRESLPARLKERVEREAVYV